MGVEKSGGWWWLVEHALAAKCVCDAVKRKRKRKRRKGGSVKGR